MKKIFSIKRVNPYIFFPLLPSQAGTTCIIFQMWPTEAVYMENISILIIQLRHQSGSFCGPHQPLISARRRQNGSHIKGTPGQVQTPLWGLFTKKILICRVRKMLFVTKVGLLIDWCCFGLIMFLQRPNLYR